MAEYLYSKVRRCFPISDRQVNLMRHIQPIWPVQYPQGGWYKFQENGLTVHPRNVAFNWNVKTVGEPFTFGSLQSTTIITQHKCAYFFKPSLAEVYAAIVAALGKRESLKVRYFCLGDSKQFHGTTDYYCETMLFDGPRMIHGEHVGSGCYRLMPVPGEECFLPKKDS